MIPPADAPRGEVLLYASPDGQVRVDVRLEENTVWLSIAQMAELFGRDKSVIGKHLRGVFADGELDREAVAAKNAATAADGKTPTHAVTSEARRCLSLAEGIAWRLSCRRVWRSSCASP